MLFECIRGSVCQRIIGGSLLIFCATAPGLGVAYECSDCGLGYVRCVKNCLSVCGVCVPETLCNNPTVPDCSSQCPTECPSFQWRAATGKENVSVACEQSVNESTGQYVYACKYKCNDGYYYSSGWATSPVCTKCPSNATCRDNNLTCNAGYYRSGGSCVRCPYDSDTGRYGTSAAGATSINNCYISSGVSGNDGMGNFIHSSNCSYN